MPQEKKSSPQVEGQLRHILRIPQTVYKATGIVVNGRRIKSFVFTTDLAIIRNCDADAVFAVQINTRLIGQDHACLNRLS